ncbi:protein FAM53C-like [Stylophora pistillata]|uniref:protein FAM53C-like n=1 Tax=Stylophora pistillata TaxID=50429 RepID=UPI000C03FC0B|nr:protein FAM53C-like [Stylophora pistillata]XP_022802918.1 protein FAM53C-like [Stylophora pistillata]XP_022802919.1 protein FAM53C-like [Stylophora pistillata]XP_022802920.1 protein FAM53C-like [Stylophora pistillata]
MVTVITDKLKNQSLEDLPRDEPEINAIQLRVLSSRNNHVSECPIAYRLHGDVRQTFGHSRTRSYPSHRPRRTYCNNCSVTDSSAMHSTTLPPANKKLCSSLSLLGSKSTEVQPLWAPRASAVWQAVENCEKKPRSVSCPDDKFKLAELLWINSEVESISTPPASPTPRPASADAALGEKHLFTKNESPESDPTCSKINENRDLNFNWKPNLPGLHRSRSQPCFDRKKSGVKRRIEDDFDSHRPALDLAKMEETSYFRCQNRKKGLRIPKYMNKKCSRGLTNYFAESENFTLKPIASSPLCAPNSSVMITPSSSPTKQLDSEIEIIEELKGKNKTSDFQNEGSHNLNPKAQDEGVFHLDYNSDLDLNSIEDDLF